MIDLELRMIVHIHPILLADVRVDDESAVVILMRVADRLGDVVPQEGGVGHFGELADGDVGLGLLVLGRARHRR